jgi:Isochorismatase family
VAAGCCTVPAAPRPAHRPGRRSSSSRARASCPDPRTGPSSPRPRRSSVRSSPRSAIPTNHDAPDKDAAQPAQPGAMPLPEQVVYAMPTNDSLPTPTVSWALDPRRCALLVHDRQKYFLAGYTPGAQPLAPLLGNIALLQRECRASGVPVIHSGQGGDPSRPPNAACSSTSGATARARRRGRSALLTRRLQRPVTSSSAKGATALSPARTWPTSWPAPAGTN